MPSKKKKYNARFPAGRIKKIMQTDEDVGKVAQAVPVIISRTLELFVESLLKRAMQITSAKNAKTLTPSHMKQCILSESRFDFLKDLVRGIPDILSTDDELGMPVGNVSPGVSPPCVKLSSGHSFFQYRRKSDSGSSKTTVTNSQVSFVPQATLPKFYNEITTGDDIKNDKRLEPIPCRTPVIQHTGHKVNNRPSAPSLNVDREKSPLRSFSGTCDGSQVSEDKYKISIRNSENQNSSSEEDEDDNEENEPQENGYHRLEIVTKTCAIDEDYDT